MERYGDLFPDRPANLEELVDQLARRAMAAQRLMSSLSAEQRDELAGLMDQALSDAGLAAEMAPARRRAAGPPPGDRHGRMAAGVDDR